MYTDLIKETYCQCYGVNPERLSTVKRDVGGGRERMVKVESERVHIDFMRMCLAHYFVYILRLPTKFGGTKAGYISHSTVIHNRPVMVHYINTKDPYLYPYWEKLMEVVKLYENDPQKGD